MENKFEKRIHDALRKEHLEFNKEEMRESIFAHLPHKRKRRLVPFLWLGAGVILFSLLWYMNYPSLGLELVDKNSHSFSVHKVKESKDYLTSMDLADSSNYKRAERERGGEDNIVNQIDEGINGLSILKDVINEKEEKFELYTNSLLGDDKSMQIERTGVREEIPAFVRSGESLDDIIGKDDDKGNHVLDEISVIDRSSINKEELAFIDRLPIAPFVIDNYTVEPLVDLDQGLILVKETSSRVVLSFDTHVFKAKTDLRDTRGLFSTDAQVLIRYRSKHISPFIGIRHSRINTVLDHTWTEVNPFESLDQATMFCPNGAEDCLRYSLLSSTTRHVNYNYIDSWELPVGILYESHGRLNFWTRGLIAIPIRRAIKYEYLDEASAIVDIETLDDFDWSYPISFQVSTGLGFKITRALELNTGIGYTTSIGSIELNPGGIVISSSRLSYILGIGYFIH